MANPTPTVGLKGVYTLSVPFSADPKVVYTCAALRRFVDLENQGVDVYDRYYAPLELTREVFNRDRRDDVAIVTLTSQTQAPIYVPGSFISSFPSLGNVNYHHVVVSASLGLLADTIDLSYAQKEVASALSLVIGSEPEVLVSVAPHDEAVSYPQHQAIEANRQAALRNSKTTRAENLRLQNQNQKLQQQLREYERVLKHHGLLS